MRPVETAVGEGPLTRLGELWGYSRGGGDRRCGLLVPPGEGTTLNGRI